MLSIFFQYRNMLGLIKIINKTVYYIYISGKFKHLKPIKLISYNMDLVT